MCPTSPFDPDALKETAGPLGQSKGLRHVLSLEGELAAGERIIWQGGPRPGVVFRKGLPVLIFALPWTGFALFWEKMALSPLLASIGGDWLRGPELIAAFLLPLFGVPFLIIGINLLSKPFRAARLARNTIYALTDLRVIVKRGTMIESYPLADLAKGVVLRQSGDGCGDILLRPEQQGQKTFSFLNGTDGLYALAEVTEIYKKIGRAVENVGNPTKTMARP